MKMTREMERFIDEVYHEPYSLLGNNCFHKSAKIVRKARKLGLEAKLVIEPIAIILRCTFPFIPRILPHCFVRLEGQKVDVALDPDTEKIWCKNSQIISFASIDLPEEVQGC